MGANYSDAVADRMWADLAFRRYSVYLGELAIARGWVDPSGLEDALNEQAVRRIEGSTPPIGEILVARGRINAQQLADLLEEQRRLTPAPFDAVTARGTPAEVREAERGAGGVLGPYVLVKEIGQGGMGAVWKAWDKRLGRWVAVKVLREYAKGAARDRFVRESLAAARLRHPHIVTVFDAGEENGKPYIAMELVSGTPLPLHGPLRRTVETLHKIALAVEEAHRKGIVHRDLKPGNILIDEHGEPRIVDFGLAHMVDDTSRMTKTGMTIGTPQYMAPEQVDGASTDVAPALDVYSMGVMLYEAMSGRPPHVGGTPSELFSKIVHAKAPELNGPRDLVAICYKAMEKDPRRRHRSAAAFAEDLKRHLDGAPPASKKALPWIAGVAALVTLATGAMWLGAGLLRESREQRAAKEKLALELAVQERLKPDIAFIQETRHLQYAGKSDAAARREALERRLKELEPFANAHAGFAEIWTTLGIGWYVAGDLDAAELAFRKADKLDPDDGLASFHLSRIYADRMIEAKLVSTVPLAAPDIDDRVEYWNTKAGRQLARPTRGWTGPSKLDLAVAAAYQAFGRNELDVVQRRFLEGRIEFGDAPGAEEFWNLEGCVRAIRGDTTAVDCFTKALAIRPHYAWALTIRGCLHRGLGKLEASLADFNAAVRLHPKAVGLRTNRAGLLRKNGAFQDALADYDVAIRLRPEDARIWNDRGALKKAMGNPAEALKDFTESIRLDASLPEPYVHRAMLWRDEKKIPQAIADLEEALRRAASSWNRRDQVLKMLNALEKQR